MSDFSFSPFGGDFGLVTILTAVSLLAVWVPLYRALRVCLQARRATRTVPEASLEKALDQPAAGRESLAVVMYRVLAGSLEQGRSDGYAPDFVVDASRQYVHNEYASHYASVISMYANLLPPIGFIGTTGGMLILFVSLHVGQVSLELGALALALTSSIFALAGFAILEGLKIRLYGRLLRCIDQVVDLQRRSARARA